MVRSGQDVAGGVAGLAVGHQAAELDEPGDVAARGANRGAASLGGLLAGDPPGIFDVT